MRPQKVSVDGWYMLVASCTCLGLALAGRVLIRLIQAIFWLPGHLEKMHSQMEEHMIEQARFEAGLQSTEQYNNVLFSSTFGSQTLDNNNEHTNSTVSEDPTGGVEIAFSKSEEDLGKQISEEDEAFDEEEGIEFDKEEYMVEEDNKTDDAVTENVEDVLQVKEDEIPIDEELPDDYNKNKNI